MVVQTDAKNRVPTEQHVFVGTAFLLSVVDHIPILWKRATTQGPPYRVFDLLER
jgi:hypothetical protein